MVSLIALEHQARQKRKDIPQHAGERISQDRPPATAFRSAFDEQILANMASIYMILSAR